MTEVNIATEIIIDVYQDLYYMAVLIFGKRDLVHPIRAVHNNFEKMRLFIVFPPKRPNNSFAIFSKKT
jgi:hypothetical protein